jgi:hypothetical protein
MLLLVITVEHVIMSAAIPLNDELSLMSTATLSPAQEPLKAPKKTAAKRGRADPPGGDGDRRCAPARQATLRCPCCNTAIELRVSARPIAARAEQPQAPSDAADATPFERFCAAQASPADGKTSAVAVRVAEAKRLGVAWAALSEAESATW